MEKYGSLISLHPILIQMSDTLLSTLIRELQSKSAPRKVEADVVARRFIRSVGRIFVIASVELAPVVKKA
jgi:E3 ubiquitin-protein ligase EDD1